MTHAFKKRFWTHSTILFDRCHTNDLTKSESHETILQRGNADVFDLDLDLGSCNYEEFKSNHKLLVFKARSFGYDGWLMNFAMVFFKGKYFSWKSKLFHNRLETFPKNF